MSGSLGSLESSVPPDEEWGREWGWGSLICCITTDVQKDKSPRLRVPLNCNFSLIYRLCLIPSFPLFPSLPSLVSVPQWYHGNKHQMEGEFNEWQLLTYGSAQGEGKAKIGTKRGLLEEYETNKHHSTTTKWRQRRLNILILRMHVPSQLEDVPKITFCKKFWKQTWYTVREEVDGVNGRVQWQSRWPTLSITRCYS